MDTLIEKVQIVQLVERVLMPRVHPFSGERVGVEGASMVLGETFPHQVAQIEPLYQVPLSDGRFLIGLQGIAQQRTPDLWVVTYDEWVGNHSPSKIDGLGRQFVRRDGTAAVLSVPTIWQNIFTIERVLVNLFATVVENRRAAEARARARPDNS